MNRVLWLLALAILTLDAGRVRAQDEYLPGTFQIAPEVDLHLQPVEIVVPSKFKDQQVERCGLHIEMQL